MSLLAPAFLAGLLAIGLPLWLHRLSSDNPNRRPFSSLMFLEPGEPRRVLAKRLQYLLLLALRIGVLVLLVLAFAQPTLWRSPQAAAGASASLHVVLVDASASMAHGERWNRARQEALGVIDSIGGGDQAQLLAAGRVTEILTEPTADRALLRQRLDTLAPSVFRVDYGQLMRAVDGLLRNVELPVVLHLITDAQRTALPNRFAELAPRRSMTLNVLNVAEGDDDNWAVESFGGSAVTGELEATVRSHAGEPADRTVRLELNGSVVDEQTVSLPAGGSAQVRFQPLELSSGVNRVTATLVPGDELALDDRRYLALKRPEPRAVLLVDGDPRGRGALYTSSAMATLEALALEPERVAPNALTDRDLTGYGFVVVTDAGALGNAAVALLADYVEGGGALLMAFGPRSTALAEVPVTGHGFRIAGRAPTARGAEHMTLGMLDAGHPALNGVSELRAARFFRYATIEPTPQDSVLMRLDDDVPLLLERRVGNGRVLLFTSSLDREWNDVPVQPAFVPFVAGLSDYLLGGAGFSSEAALGSTLAVRAMGLRGGQIFDPRGRAALTLGGTDDALLDQVGFYEVVGGGRTELVAVNFDARESDLRTMDEATIERWQQLAEPQTAAAAPAEQTRASMAVPLGPWVLWLLVIAAIMESWVGNWHLKVRRAM